MNDGVTERIPTPAEAARAAREQGENTPFRFDRSTIVHRTPEHPVREGIEVLSTEFNADPFDHFRWMHENAPLYWDDVEGIWGVTSHADISHIEVQWGDLLLRAR